MNKPKSTYAISTDLPLREVSEIILSLKGEVTEYDFANHVIYFIA